MMDPRMSAMTVRLQHRHNDGSWSDLKRKSHDLAANDPERGWADAQLFECTTCEEEVRVSVEQPGQPGR